MSSIDDAGIAPNAKRLLWAGFMAILAAGVGFSIRGGILGDWGEQFGFTQGDLGQITGGGLTGFGIIILIKAFKKSLIWGLGSLLIPFVILVFVFMNWADTKKPFLYSVGCWVVMMIGGALAGMSGAAAM